MSDRIQNFWEFFYAFWNLTIRQLFLLSFSFITDLLSKIFLSLLPNLKES